jgi:Domain of unknown function (DUF4864)
MRSLRTGRRSMSAHVPRRGWPAVLRLGMALALAACSALGAAMALAAEPELRAPDWKAIKNVITAQRAALIAGDGGEAFSYATPSLRTQFGDAATFMAMVHLGYQALLSARYTEFLEGAVIEGLVIQPLRLIDADNSVRVALYTLEKQPNGAWRISGCRIGASTVQAAQWRPDAPRSPAMRNSASSKRLA